MILELRSQAWSYIHYQEAVTSCLKELVNQNIGYYKNEITSFIVRMVQSKKVSSCPSGQGM